MTEISIALYGKDAEVISEKRGADAFVCFKLTPKIDADISIFGKKYTVKDGNCIIEYLTHPDGEYYPKLITDSETISLPKIVKDGKLLFADEVTPFLIRSLSLRERLLEEKFAKLESQVSKISKSVFETTLF